MDRETKMNLLTAMITHTRAADKVATDALKLGIDIDRIFFQGETGLKIAGLEKAIINAVFDKGEFEKVTQKPVYDVIFDNARKSDATTARYLLKMYEQGLKEK